MAHKIVVQLDLTTTRTFPTWGAVQANLKTQIVLVFCPRCYHYTLPKAVRRTDGKRGEAQHCQRCDGTYYNTTHCIRIFHQRREFPER